jgi:hypothetical protein
MITTVELEIQQDQDTGAQLSVVPSPIKPDPASICGLYSGDLEEFKARFEAEDAINSTSTPQQPVADTTSTHDDDVTDTPSARRIYFPARNEDVVEESA